jgi:dynein heavy chain 1
VVRRPSQLDALRAAIILTCEKRHLSPDQDWTEKIIQLYQVQQISHGVMLVGPAASGKSEAWRVLLDALEQIDKVEGVCYVMDPKAIDKDALYGDLDSTTREWTDGLFTSILRKITDNARGESLKRHWIVFDGDVDPEWVENLNRYVAAFYE